MLNLGLRAEWLFLKNSKDENHDIRKTQSDWKFWRMILRRKSKLGSCSVKENMQLAFELKCINKLLPVLKNLQIRYPETYSSSTCRVCKEEEETTEHIVCCRKVTEVMRGIETKSLRKAIETVDKENARNITFNTIASSILDPSETIMKRRRELWIRGILMQDLLEKLQEELDSASRARALFTIFWKEWMRGVFENIWKMRCVLMQDWEKRIGIGRQDKLGKRVATENRIKTRRKQKKKDREKEIEEKRGKKSDIWSEMINIIRIEYDKWITTGCCSEWWIN
jgi:hypothetical protein